MQPLPALKPESSFVRWLSALWLPVYPGMPLGGILPIKEAFALKNTSLRYSAEMVPQFGVFQRVQGYPSLMSGFSKFLVRTKKDRLFPIPFGAYCIACGSTGLEGKPSRRATVCFFPMPESLPKRCLELLPPYYGVLLLEESACFCSGRSFGGDFSRRL